MSRRRYTVLSLFTGAGGLDIGLDRTGRFTTLACVELEKDFCNTLEANRDAGRFGTKRTKVIQGDISRLDPGQLMHDLGLKPGELDVLVGGPPCQSFSTVGRRGTIQDTRGTLIWKFLSFVKAFQPKFFVMENVRGLLSAAIEHRPIKDRPGQGGPPLRLSESPGSVIEQWVEALHRETEGAYRVDCFEVNAVNYGAPQLRERVLFFGNRLGHRVRFPEPSHGTGIGEAPFTTLGNALDKVVEDDGEVLDFSPRKKRYLEMIPEGGNWRTLPIVVQQESMGRAFLAKGGRSGWWRRLSRSLPCPTIVTMPNHASTAMCHPTFTRALTLRECAAVQEFPLSWEFKGTTQQKYIQVGNAIPIRLGEITGNLLAEHLAAGQSDEKLAPEGCLPYRRVYVRSHVRTRQWFKDGRTFLWVDGADNTESRYSAAGRARVAVG